MRNKDLTLFRVKFRKFYEQSRVKKYQKLGFSYYALSLMYEEVKYNMKDKKEKIVQLVEFFKPTKIKIVLWVVFILISLAGRIQSYAFTDGETYGLPKPLFYDLLEPFPFFWGFYMYLRFPLSILGSIFNIYLFSYLSSLIDIVYFYILASLLGVCYEKVKSPFLKK